MYLKEWIQKWLIAVLACLIIFMGCAAGLLWNHYSIESKTASKAVINQVRLQVNAMMLYLAQHHEDMTLDPKLQETLRNMTQDQQVSLLYAGLDGEVLYNSSEADPRKQIDINTELHYDLYQSKVNKDLYNIAFPVLDEVANTQVGNAIFTVPESKVFTQKSHAIPLSLFIVMVLFLFVLCCLMFLLWKKMKDDIIQPVHDLKNYSEAILKGNYGQTMVYTKMDEIGEVYAMFDQMRMEIVYHSLRRDEQEQAQKELISNISHELKTPLTSLTTYIEIIREGGCSDMSSVMEYVEVMHNNAQKMTRLTEDLLQHALKELGQISVTLTEQYSREVLVKILQPVGHYVRSTGVSFTEPLIIPNVLIHVDAHRLEQVISNIISNALKHTSAGDSILVNTELERGYLKISIEDTGKGILPQDMPFVFDRYFKGESKLNPAAGGTGLGLSICKYIMEAHQGSISFRSVPDQGTIFYCLIPVG
ncbi:HAMP domain-containing sensor histidine kinase [Paenibacillus sp. Marseille-Q4541]|uniref:HAMP domain-containing sensor histidine kinase n=1 Tax=Paenibacillus sp. Marseille-Q4541 TaxID=2831522 RepID=UPI001BADB99C|nr:HAMP domain-containing sensor histidine kinase [Paenibacillus sp. Marseille-Q4541]